MVAIALQADGVLFLPSPAAVIGSTAVVRFFVLFVHVVLGALLKYERMLSSMTEFLTLSRSSNCARLPPASRDKRKLGRLDTMAVEAIKNGLSPIWNA